MSTDIMTQSELVYKRSVIAMISSSIRFHRELTFFAPGYDFALCFYFVPGINYFVVITHPAHALLHSITPSLHTLSNI